MLTSYDTAQLKKVVAAVTTHVPAEKIFLLGAHIMSSCYDTIFTLPPPTTRQVLHYYLLVLPESSQHRSNECWQDIIEHHCRVATPVTAWVLQAAKFVQWLEAGQPFACRVYRDGFLCYDAGRVALPAPPPLDEKEAAVFLRRECMHYINRSAEFLHGAELYYLRRQYRPGVFLLHQSAEQAYIAINWQATGFRPMVHSLEKLHRYALAFSTTVDAVFPKNNEQEDHLFRLLQKAYVDTRYTSGYTIEGGELLCLMGRVGKLLEIAKESCEL